MYVIFIYNINYYLTFHIKKKKRKNMGILCVVFFWYFKSSTIPHRVRVRCCHAYTYKNIKEKRKNKKPHKIKLSVLITCIHKHSHGQFLFKDEMIRISSTCIIIRKYLSRYGLQVVFASVPVIPTSFLGQPSFKAHWRYGAYDTRRIKLHITAVVTFFSESSWVSLSFALSMVYPRKQREQTKTK